MRLAWLVAVQIFATTPVRAQQIVLTGPLQGAANELPHRARGVGFELHVFQRVGFAWVVPRHAGVFSSSLGASYDVLRIASDVSLTLVADLDDRRDPARTTSFGGGFGLLYAHPQGVALALESVLSVDWDDVGVWPGLSARLTFTPYYISIRDVDRCVGGPITAFIASSISIWALARADWVERPNDGVTLAFGASVDLMHALVDPVVQAARSDWTRCVRADKQSAPS